MGGAGSTSAKRIAPFAHDRKQSDERERLSELTTLNQLLIPGVVVVQNGSLLIGIIVAGVSDALRLQHVTYRKAGRSGHVTVRVVANTAYVRGDAFALENYMGIPPSVATGGLAGGFRSHRLRRNQDCRRGGSARVDARRAEDASAVPPGQISDVGRPSPRWDNEPVSPRGARCERDALYRRGGLAPSRTNR